MSSLPDDGAAAGGGLDSALMMDFLAAIFISIYLNSCFLVAEAIFIAHGPQGHLRHMIDSMAHILSGPIAFIAVYPWAWGREDGNRKMNKKSLQ